VPSDEIKQEYRDGTRLEQRVNLHDLFSRNRRGWHPWVFDQLTFPPDGQILELGCGLGLLWQRNSDRIPAEWRVTLSDFSMGMLAEAQAKLQGFNAVSFTVADAQAIPFADGCFDGVIANHMLYYIPDRRKVYAEIERVLKPGGRLYAATNGQLSMRQYDELIDECLPGYRQERGSHRDDLFQGHFYLENGYVELAQWFSMVSEKRYDDALIVTEAEPLVAYVESSGHLDGQALAGLRRRVEQVIALQGALQIDKVAGVLIATKGLTGGRI